MNFKIKKSSDGNKERLKSEYESEIFKLNDIRKFIDGVIDMSGESEDSLVFDIAEDGSFLAIDSKYNYYVIE